MNCEAGPKILTEDDAYVDPAKSIGLHENLPGPEHSSYGTRPLRITAPNDHSSQARRRVGVAEKDHIDAV